MAAIIPDDEEYLKTSTVSLVAHRLPWLLLLMISATFTSTIITHFEELLASAVALTAFIPMLMDSAGNSGSQTSVTVIRSMALGEVELRDWLRVLFKELRVALIAGAALAAVNFLRMILFTSSGMMIALTVSVTLLCTVIIAMIVGCLLPMGAKRLGFDPAVMASPMITTIVDACSLLIYFMIASGHPGIVSPPDILQKMREDGRGQDHSRNQETAPRAPPAKPGARGAVSDRQQNAFLPPKGRKDSHHPMISEKATPVRHERDADVNKPGGCGNMSIKQRNYATSLSHALTTNSRSGRKEGLPNLIDVQDGKIHDLDHGARDVLGHGEVDLHLMKRGENPLRRGEVMFPRNVFRHG